MFAVLIIIHVMACLALIGIILLQAGRGGGLSEVFGGGSTQTIFGTRVSTFLTRATTVCAIVFILTSLGLGALSSRRGASLMEREAVEEEAFQEEIEEGLDITAEEGEAEE